MVSQAKDQLKPDATAIYVAAQQAAGAIEEAIEAEIPLLVAVAEHIPLHDMLRVQSMLRSQSKSRLVGANSPGMISAVGKCRLGFHPLPTFTPGNIAIVAKSGTLSYETVASTTRAGLGQSLVIGMGGDPLPGTDFVDALKVFEHDVDTHGIILVGEIGGRAEEDAAEWIKEYRKRAEKPKPVMALIAGIQAPSARVMGHAGAFVGAGEKKAAGKVRALEDAGVVITNHPSKFGEGMKRLLDSEAHGIASVSDIRDQGLKKPSDEACTLFEDIAYKYQAIMLTSSGARFTSQNPKALECSKTLGTNYTSCIVTSFSIGGESPQLHAKTYPLALDKIEDDSMLSTLAADLDCKEESLDSLSLLLSSLIDIFFGKEATSLSTRISRNQQGELAVARAEFSFDDAAFRSGKRHADLQEMRDTSNEVPGELEAEKDGIVYIKLRGEGNIVNGAGLAMNTVDAIADLGGKCANFLDTGGKATSETVKSSFRIILKDPRVKTIFVNIFGGLTLCDMIADGIMLAYKDLGITVPVVVRLRGTNEEIGQKMIAESGLSLYAFDDFDEAASKVIELTRQSE
ncbi:hypothetical protein IMSHALPRED_007813 [Imshaugia aleurites]|uniref:ATP-citrate synthase/succinyl-CoA ligase C-terminal domain-containing protein n=1 Tax=Imshaugia aleurites TaxID=172621 RepID=A0A8H3FN55_9LECA|nr:hypothetical protein IMSHALPRED_007813 [Imshaugia aleurites]